MAVEAKKVENPKLLEYKLVAIDKLVPYAKNAQLHTPEQIDKLVAIIKEVGWTNPILLQRPFDVVAGHGRIMAGKQIGYTELPCLFVEDMTEVQRRAYILADNQMTKMAEWDKDLLQGEAEFLLEQGYDIQLTGFELDEFGFDNPDDPDEDEEADDEEESETPPKAKLGEIYVLGNHRLMCGDSGNLEHVARLMDGEKAKMVFTDPPYNVDYSGNGKNTSSKIMNDHMEDGAFSEFLVGVFAAMKEFSQPNAPAYVCYASREHRAFENSLEENGYKVRAQIIWVKNIASFGFANYKWKHEPILYCVPADMPVDFYGDRKQITTWEYKPSDEELLKEARALLESENDEDKTVWHFDRDTDYEHPTQKPVRLPARAIINSSRDNDIVLDLFGGSGSTLIAAEHTNRHARLMELDPKYVDKIIERWERLTGEKAEKVE